MSQEASGQISTVMQEERLFPPSTAFSKAAHIGSLEQYETLWKQAAEDSEAYWAKLAEEDLPRFEPFTEPLDWKAPLAQWFVDGKTNVSYNCLDVHLATE